MTLPSVSAYEKVAHALGVHESQMLRAAGRYLSDGHEPSDDQLLEPELRVFFRDVWPNMSEDERGMVREFVGMVKSRMNRNTVSAGRKNECT